MSTDPRNLGGDIAGPGGPHDQGAVIIDTTKSVLLDSTSVAMVDNPSDGRRFCAVALAGRVNQSTDRAQVLYLMDADGLASIVSEAMGLAYREGGEFQAAFEQALADRMEVMP